MNESIDHELSAATLLEQHHRRLDDMLDDVELMADAENWKHGQRRFDEFRREMEAHIRLEEETMFPAFERDPTTSRGPTIVMRAEHDAIGGLLEGVQRALIEERPISRMSAELKAQLGAHNFKEERILYPAFERTAPVPVRAALAAQTQALLTHRG